MHDEIDYKVEETNLVLLFSQGHLLQSLFHPLDQLAAFTSVRLVAVVASPSSSCFFITQHTAHHCQHPSRKGKGGKEIALSKFDG